MKLVVALLALVLPLAAQAEGMKDMDMKAENKAGQEAVHKAAGVVTRVDAAKNKVTIKHGPVQSIGWPAMTMTFAVKDKAMLDKLAQGRKVDFQFKEEGGHYLITSVR